MRTRSRPTRFIVAGIVVAFVLAGVASYYASGYPDGLTAAAQQLGFIETEQTHARGGSTFAGYATEGVENDRLSGGIAGIVGVAITFVVGGLLFFALRGRGDDPPQQHGKHE